MCRNIKTLFNFKPPASEQEIRAAALQFVRKVSGSSQPSQLNQAACDNATVEISAIVSELLDSLITRAAPKDRTKKFLEPGQEQQSGSTLPIGREFDL
jgi:hypothetical protein